LGRKYPLEPHEAATWNTLAKSMEIEDLFESGLRKLRRIIESAENLP
jgi:hypothetical protein